MSDSNINRALEALTDAYVARGKAVARVKAKYAKYDQELAAAKQEDINAVGEALVAAWNAGATVAATGRALGAANIYNARRAIYDAARAIQGETSQTDKEFLDRLAARATGRQDLGPRDVDGALPGMWEDADLVGGSPDTYPNEEQEDTRVWVQSWTINGPDAVGAYKVIDPAGRVSAVTQGIIFGEKNNLAEFKDDAELHALVTEIHGIPTKEFKA